MNDVVATRTSVLLSQGRISAEGIPHLRNPNIVSNSGMRVLEFRIWRPNSGINLGRLSLQRKTLHPQIHTSRFNPEVGLSNSHCTSAGPLRWSLVRDASWSLEKGMLFTCFKTQAGWLVQAEGPPSALLSRLKKAIVAGSAKDEDSRVKGQETETESLSALTPRLDFHFLAFLACSRSLLFCAFCFPGILGVRQKEKSLLFSGVPGFLYQKKRGKDGQSDIPKCGRSKRFRSQKDVKERKRAQT